ncbi:MAG: LysE family translocator [Acidihalobacter sp.]|uniref:LysE family translocator n=1 Tax=Acidihalobacter sp. TaxID=1872108 RepID=UPI00307F8D50
MDSASYWLMFFSAALAINISPGPDLIYVLSRTVAEGRKVGFASLLGIWTGALVHVSAAALGLSAILATSEIAFAAVKYVGAAYLIYLGIKALRAKTPVLEAMPAARRTTPWMAYRQGVSVDILNPKAAIFFLAFLPQFVRPELGHVPAQIMLLGLLVIALAVVVESSAMLMAACLTKALRGNVRISAWLQRIFGSVLIGLGVRLALIGRAQA